MKVFHIVCGRPIGPTFTAYLERPELLPDPDDQCGTWVEETTLEELAARFAEHVRYAAEHFPESYFPYELKIEVSHARELRRLLAVLGRDGATAPATRPST